MKRWIHQKELNFIFQFPLSAPPPFPIIFILVYGITIRLVTQTEYTGVSQTFSVLFTASI